MENKVVSLPPLSNNMLIFRTDKDSNHGFPDKLLCPENILRKSIALYYYVDEKRVSPIQFKRKHYTTVWKKDLTQVIQNLWIMIICGEK